MTQEFAKPDHVEEVLAADLDNGVPSRGYQMLPVVGLGGSAGGVPALIAFLNAVPPDAGFAFVVVLHLSPEHDSNLAAVLQRATSMPVTQVTETERMAPNRVYVVPPRKALHTLDGFLRLVDLPASRNRHVAVDHFFRTLADSHGPHASAVVLSGADGDGAIGIKRIKERGGLTIAQDPSEATFQGMPRSAISTGMVDWVLPVADMPARLLEYHRQERRLRLPPEEGPRLPPSPTQAAADETQLRDVLTFLRTRTGRDFSYYKRATILRRIGRRMQVNGIDDLAGYLNCLRTRPGEAGALLQDLLISVTNFFRDGACFEALEARIPDLFRDKGHGDTVRVWVAACATGEEAYSVAMLLHEHARTLDAPPVIQVFATDLDEDAIHVAREAVYPAAIEADVSDERLRRFFLKEHRGYRVRREVREMVLFAVHDLLKDSPFSRLDLVTCRNLLIYLNREAQTRAFEVFHFALRAGGLMFLGSSESVEDGSSFFSVVDKQHRLYLQRPAPRASLAVPLAPTSYGRSVEATSPGEGGGVSFGGRHVEAPSGPVRVASRFPDGRGVSWGEVHLRLLDHLAPPSVLVDAQYDILHLSPAASRFLQFSGGEPSRNLLRSVHPALRIDLRAVLYQAAQSNEATQGPGIAVDLPDGNLTVTMRVVPARDIAPDLLLVVFESGRADVASVGTGEARAPDPVARQLDREIERLKSHLRDTVEQYEASTEELKASNEELQAMNEELRSATEELETSREELQSINEELTTVNHELKSKVDELGHANSDMHNLMDATAIATVFLDRELRITRFTPSAVALFNLIASDIGRPLTDLTSQLRYATLADDAQRVLDTLMSMEREVGEHGNRWYLARLRPYRTIDDRIAGVVLTFVDITERKRALEAQLDAEAKFRAIVSQASVGVLQVDPDNRITFANQRMRSLLGYRENEMVGMHLDALIHEDDRAAYGASVARMKLDREPFEIEKRLLRREGSEVWVHNSVAALPGVQGDVDATIAVCVDITERKLAEAALRSSEEHLRMVIENAREYAIFTTDIDRRITSWNSGAERILGYAEQEALGRSADMIFTIEDQRARVPEAEARQALADGRAGDDRFHVRKDGSLLWASGVMMSMQDGSGRIVGLVKILRDQTDARRTQQALERSQSELLDALGENEAARTALESANVAKDRFLAVLSHELRTPLTPVMMTLRTLGLRKDLPDDVHRSLDVMRRNIRAEAHLIDDLLDLTRISRGTLEFVREPVDLHQIVRAAADVCEADFQAKQQMVTLALDAPETDTVGDANRLQQIVWNLLKNASKFTPDRGNIRVSTRGRDGKWFMEVSDNGMGIDGDALPRIFDAFVQGGEWVSREYGGLGLGLSISKSTAEAHGGRLQADSRGRGQGATFTLELPLIGG